VRSRPISERRRLKRAALKKRASLIVKHGRQAQRIPCLVLDDSQCGFKIVGGLPPQTRTICRVDFGREYL
jgi:hypothetical protein